MRLVGEAVADEFHTCDLTVLGKHSRFEYTSVCTH